MIFKQGFAATLALLMLVSAGFAQAAQDPRELVQETVERMTSRIDAERERLEKDESYARELVREELVPLVDFKRITRMVMGEHFDQASRDQKYEFLEVFKNSLINTYASGVTLYQGQEIRVLPMREEDRKGNYARVRLEGTTNDGKVIPVFFTLFQSDDQWKVVNVYVNGLDLRDVYRAQFAQSMQQLGDLDKVIDSWSAESAERPAPGWPAPGAPAAGWPALTMTSHRALAYHYLFIETRSDHEIGRREGAGGSRFRGCRCGRGRGRRPLSDPRDIRCLRRPDAGEETAARVQLHQPADRR